MLATKRPACRKMMEMCAVGMSKRLPQAPASTAGSESKIFSQLCGISVALWKKQKSEVFVAIRSRSGE